MIVLGDETDSFQLGLPDIRLPANQYWPLHWHGCWVGIVILEGACLLGDWWMTPGDVLISAAELEYGPLVIGPKGCRMFEIFAKNHLLTGGYSPEYRDHPTLSGSSSPFKFAERSPLNMRNAGRQCLPVDGVEGLTKGRLAPGSQWTLGEVDDPDSGMIRVTAVAAGERLPPHLYEDWHASIVVQGSVHFAGRSLTADQYLLVKPGSHLGEIGGGEEGALLLEVARTTRALAPRRPATMAPERAGGRPGVCASKSSEPRWRP